MKEETIYELIAAHLAGETNKEQNERLYAWIDLAPENKEKIKILRMAWGMYQANFEQVAVKKTIILKKVLARSRRHRLKKPLSVAASLILALFLGFFFSSMLFRNDKQMATIPAGEILMCTMPGQKAEATLPDGTTVWLNSGTTISYPASFGMENRTAKLLKGEIFLNVAKNVERPLILETSHGFVKVLGTSFDVRDYAADSFLTISLEEGAIEYYISADKSAAKMVPGQKVTVDKSSGTIILQECDAKLESIWHFGELKIERKSFLELMAEMERWYGVEIKVNGIIPSNNHYWMTIKTESLREMLGLLQKNTPFSYKIDGKYITISLK